jgi:hypothetical protein
MRHGPTTLLWYYNGVIVELQWCYSGVTVLHNGRAWARHGPTALLWYYSDVKVVLQWWYNVVTVLVQCWHPVVHANIQCYTMATCERNTGQLLCCGSNFMPTTFEAFAQIPFLS